MASDAASQEVEDQSKAKVFISYSRKDIAFADRLDRALKARDFEPLIDRTDIYAFEEWWKRVEALIAQADTVVFVLSALDDMRGQRDDARQERDQWRGQAQSVARLLTDQRQGHQRQERPASQGDQRLTSLEQAIEAAEAERPAPPKATHRLTLSLEQAIEAVEAAEAAEALVCRPWWRRLAG
jgi:hypothetical protein